MRQLLSSPWGVLGVTLAIQALVSMTVITVPAMAPAVAQALQVSPSLVGAYIGLVYVGATVASSVAGPLVLRHGADPAPLGAIGMLTGYCGTLLTPMAANFNIVPAVLLELPDQYGVIRAQVVTALALLVVNVLLMWLLVFR